MFKVSFLLRFLAKKNAFDGVPSLIKYQLSSVLLLRSSEGQKYWSRKKEAD